MRKVLIFATILAVTMSFGFSALAQEIDCDPCKGYDWRSTEIGCPSSEQAECIPWGLPWWEFVFPICDCPDVAVNFAKGSKIGVRMHILTPGVYWAANDEGDGVANWGVPEAYDPDSEPPAGFVRNNAGIDFFAYKSAEDACGYGNINYEVYSGTFSQILFFENETCDYDEDDFDEPLPESFPDCSWTRVDHPKPVSLATDPKSETAFFTIPHDDPPEDSELPISDEDWSGYSYWVFDYNSVPEIRLDSDEVLAANLRGEPIQIRIEFVKAGDEGICTGDCLVICECIIEIAQVCDTESGCIYFPYILTQTSPWVTGIALSNVGDSIPIGDMQAEFTLTDMTGEEFTYIKDDFESAVWSNVVDSMLDEFDGTPTPGNAILKIETNFIADGFQFITDGVFGGSSLPRACKFKCNQEGCCD